MISAASALAKECTQAQALPISLVGAIDTANKTRQFKDKVKGVKEARKTQGILLHSTPQNIPQVENQIMTLIYLPQWKANATELLEKSRRKKQTWTSILLTKIVSPAKE